ncbi:MAG: aldo/keto reductase, partial [Pyrinomonadaceae bacterium]
PWNGVQAVKTGQVDSVQVIYNVFDQNPEDELFPACREMDVAIIARVPFDEGTLTGSLTKESTWPEGDWRNTYFVPENLVPSVERADKLKEFLADWNREHSTNITLPELALSFILNNPDVSTIIPGMRKAHHVEANLAASDAGPLPKDLHQELKKHRWVRKPAPWSQ